MSKLAQVKSAQAALEQRNEKVRQTIKLQQELFLGQIEARKALLEKSAQRKQNLRTAIAACDAEVSGIEQRLAEEYTELVNENLHSRSHSGHSPADKQQSNRVSEEWFAEDELSFAAHPDEGVYGPLQRSLCFTSGRPWPRT